MNAKEVPADTDLWKNRYELAGTYTLRAQNGILCWAALGKSVTAGAGPYTHTITPTTDGSLLPSFCFQHERTGSATAWRTQFRGCKVNNLTLLYDNTQATCLRMRVNWLAQKTAKVAFSLTNDPILPATANTGPFVNLTRTFAGVNIDGLVSLEISIDNGLYAEYAHTWDTGVYTGYWPQSFLEAPRKQYRVKFTYHPSTIETTIWDELVVNESVTPNTSNAVFTWTRGASDTIAVTCSDCKVIEHTIETPVVGEEQLDTVVLEPRAMSIVVVDSITGVGNYGE